MFDKITIRAKVSGEECLHLASLHHLQRWINEDGTQVNYKSSSYKKISGVEVKIEKNTVTLSCSLHKYWMKMNYGRLRNDNVFTVSEARAAFEMLLFENGLLAEKTRVVLFEIGLNMNVSYDPLTFIELVQYLPRKNDIKNDKTMFVDANYRINRQKTSEKHKDIRRYFKIYDKGWEMNEKKRTPNPPKGELTTPPDGHPSKGEFGTPPDGHPSKGELKILRIESVYRRQNEKSHEFFSDSNVSRLAKNFYMDWKDLFFVRTIKAYKGARKSEVERASIIINIGAKEYQERCKSDFEAGKISSKQYRTIREFIRDYEENKNRFKTVISAQEKEYNALIYKTYDITKK